MSSSTIHVVPVADQIEHDTDDDYSCICGPTAVHQFDGGLVVVHHSLDGREQSEGP